MTADQEVEGDARGGPTMILPAGAEVYTSGARCFSISG